MLKTNKSIIIPKKVKVLAAIFLAVSLFAYGVFFIVTALMPETQTNGQSATTQVSANKETAFDGININKADPQALQQYCDDTNAVARRLSDGSTIKDLCVLSRIANDYLPLMSEEQISKMANEDPTCLTTGFGKDGFDCFTGVDKKGCGRNGLDLEGRECSPVVTTTPTPTVTSPNALFADKQQICDLVKGCQTDALFDTLGFNQYGCNRLGNKADGTPCPHELITPIYGENNRDQLGFDTNGFNAKGCDKWGVRDDGSKCAYADITKTYDRSGRDVYGFDVDGFNTKGCNIDGLDKDGNVCNTLSITRIVDPVTGLDQFGFNAQGLNSKGCNLEGFDTNGLRCDEESITRIYGNNGLDQFGFGRNGLNKNNCNIDGLKPDGSLCSDAEITRFYDPETGLDQFGFFANGRNKFDCDAQGRKPNGALCTETERSMRVDPKTGLDVNGLSKDGYNEKGCNVNGFRRNGEICDFNDIPRILSADGIDQLGFNGSGFNAKGCDIKGLNALGELCALNDVTRVFNKENRDQFGFDKDGFNKHNCNQYGLNKQGEMCRSDMITRRFDANDVDQFGLNAQGFSVATGCNTKGFRVDGTRCAYADIPKIKNKNGVDQFGIGENGRNENNCDINGFKPDGARCAPSEMTLLYDDENMSVFHRDDKGYNRLGLNRLGFNEKNCDVNGRKPDGTTCDISDITRIYDPVTNRDQFGLDREGFNDKGCGLDGLDRAGEMCAAEDIPRVFDAQMRDQFGVSITDLPNSVWSAKQDCFNSLSPVINEQGQPVRVMGIVAYKDVNGKIKDKDCTPIRGTDGSLLSLGDEGQIIDSSGTPLADQLVSSLGGAGNQRLNSLPPKKSALISASGQRVMVDGVTAFALADGTLVDENNRPLLDIDGKPLRINSDGVIVDSKGQPLSSQRLNVPNERLMKQEGASSKRGLPLLTNADGSAIKINGKTAYIDEDGRIVDENGQIIRTTNGETITLSEDGRLVTSSGNLVTDDDLKIDGGISSTSTFGKGNTLLTNSKGQSVLINGKPAFVRADGSIVDAEGQPIRNNQGQALRLNDQGQVVDVAGNVLPNNQLSVENSGLSAATAPSLLRSETGEPILINGKAAFVRADGVIVDEKGQVVRNAQGQSLRLNSEGQIVDATGTIVPDSMLNLANKGLNASVVPKRLTSATGQPVLVNGKAAFVRDDGVLVDENGQVLRDPQGQPLRLNAQGQVIDATGALVPASALNVPNTGLMASAAQKRLTSATGQPVLVNGKAAFVRDDGVLVDENGQVLRDPQGQPLRLNAQGQVVDATGKIIPDSMLNLANKGLNASVAPKRLTSATGQPVLVNGKAAFVRDDGVLVDENGQVLRDPQGQPLRLNAQGQVVDATGALVPASALNVPNTGLMASAAQKRLTSATGQPVLVNGKAAFVRDDGVLVDENGQVLRDPQGQPLRLNDQGQVVNNMGLPVADSVLNVDNNGLSAAKDSAALLANGTAVTRNGELVYVDEKGQLRNPQGDPLLSDQGEELYLNSNGVIVDKNGVPVDLGSLNLDGTLPANTRLTTSPIMLGEQARAALAAASGISQNQRRSIGLNDDGFNAKGCALNGLNREGNICELTDVPRIFDNAGFDQFGLRQDGYNRFGCNLEGINRQGKPCEENQITKIYGLDGFDQFGFNALGKNAAGLSRAGLNVAGCDAAGKGPGCALADTPRLVDGAGVDQFNKRNNQQDRLGLINGFNKQGCDINALNNLGERCELVDTPRLFDANGMDQFGLDINGKNRFGCDLNGRKEDGTLCRPDEITRIFDANNIDQFGLNQQMRNEFGCDIMGQKADGSLCDGSEITKIYDKNQRDQFGLNAEGFNDKGCNLSGFNMQGERCAIADIPLIIDAQGYNQFGLNSAGRNLQGCDLNGLRTDGTRCEFSDIPRIIDPATGLDQFGIDKNGFNASGCSLFGYDKEGQVCEPESLTQLFDINEIDQFGINKLTGKNENGCDLNGLREDGSVCPPSRRVKFIGENGKDQYGLANGVNENGCDINGLKADGSRCDLVDVTKIIDKTTGLDQFGLDLAGRNKIGCDINGLDPSGNPCSPQDITKIYDANNIDQFGLGKNGFNSNGCNLLGRKADGSRCEPSATPAIYGNDGFSQIGFNQKGLDRWGFKVDGFDEDGCNIDNMRADGSFCAKFQKLDLSSDDGLYMDERKALIAAWLTKAKTGAVPKDIAEGTYSQEAIDAAKAQEQIQYQQTAQQFALVEATRNANEAATSEEAVVKIPMGHVMLIDVRTPVNSDYTSDVYATIIGGELDGAQLRGFIEVPYIDDPVMPRDKFRYKFNYLMWERRAYSIDATSLNMDNDSGMVSADSVDYHRWQRYGGLLIASGVQALDATFLDSQDERNAQLQSDAVNEATQNAILLGQNTTDLTKQNLKTATSNINELAKQQFTRRPTIKKGSSQHFIIFNQEVIDPNLPLVIDGIEY